MALEILVVDDEADIRELIAAILNDEGYATRTAKDSDTTLAALAERRPSLLVLDIWLQGSRLDGIELLEEVKRRDPDAPGHHHQRATATLKRRSARSSAAHTTSSRSRSRPTSSFSSSPARPKPSG